MLTVVFMYAVLAATFTIAKKALAYSNPYFLIGFRMTVAGLLFLGLTYLSDRKSFQIKREDLWLFVRTSFFYIYLAFIPEFWALSRLTSSKVVIIYSITPFIAATLAYFLASERLTKLKVLGMLVGTAGIVPLLITSDQVGKFSSELFTVSAAEGVLLLAVFAGAYGWFPVKKLMTKGYSLPMINGTTMLLGGLAAFATSFTVEGVFTTHILDFWPFLFWVLLLVVVANGIFYNMYGWHLRKYSFTILSLAGFLCPIFGTIYGWLFLNEQITWHHGASLILIGGGLYLFYREELKNKS